jgi:voltage-gated potassium channel
MVFGEAGQERRKRRRYRFERLLRVFAEAARGHHLRVWFGVVALIASIGTAGYWLQGWNVSDALYMTVITLTTVGFKEVRDITTFHERLWTMILAVSGVAIIYGTIGFVAESIISEAASGRREVRRMRQAVGRLEGHFVVCGYGRVGATVAREFEHTGEPLVVIDILPASLERANKAGLLVVEGDATDDATLRAAGVDKAKGLVTCIDSDANNVYVTLSARAMNPGLFIVSRANTEGAEAKLLQAGANRVVSPYTNAGRRIAELAVRPHVADYIDAALSHGNLTFSLEDIEVTAGGSLVGRTVASLREVGVVTLAILRVDGAYEANPAETRTLAAGEHVIASGSTQALASLENGA